jgi:hypothetical protein
MNQTQRESMTDRSEGSVDEAQRSDMARAELALSRRRMLLKGIGKGSALLAAAAPIKTLASTASVTANGQICSVSGVQSAVHSQSTQLPTCGGKGPAFYATISNWPSGDTTYTVGSKTFSKTTKFNALFGSGSTSNLMNILKQSPLPAEAHWITALLNSIKPPSTYVFPYSAQEVFDLYVGPQQAAALAFFRGYMETVV